MRIVSVLSILALLGLAAGAVFAAPNGTDEKPWEYTYGPPRAIVPEVEPNDTCPGQTMMVGDRVEPAFLTAGEFDWYSFSANAGDILTLTVGPYNGSAWDSYLELYGACDGTMLTYDDDSGEGTFSMIQSWSVPATGTYYAKVRGYNSTYTGDYVFSVAAQGAAPENDTCAGAIAIERCTNGTLTGDLTPYINQYDPGVPGPSCTGYSAAGKDEVYKVDAQPGDILQLSYTQLSADGSFYVVTDCANVSGTCVAGADATVGGQAETISYTVTTAGTYYIILDCYGTNAGAAWTFTYDINCAGPFGACCRPNGTCFLVQAPNCVSPNTWNGSAACSPNPCPSPVEETSWGQIKASYR